MCAFTNCRGVKPGRESNGEWHKAKREILGSVISFAVGAMGYSWLLTKAATDSRFDATGGLAFIAGVSGIVACVGFALRARQRIVALRQAHSAQAPQV